MLLHDSKFASIEYDEQLSLIIHTWKAESSTMSAEDFKNEMNILAEQFKKLKPRKVLVDQREFFFTVIPTLQRWVDQNVNKILLEQGNEKLAFVVSPDILAKITVSQTLNESHSQNLNAKFFDDYRQARQWIEI